MYVQSWIQAKLWLKHHINPDAIDEVLNNASEPEEDFRHAASGRRFVMQTQASDLRLRIVLADDGPCPHPLITAFEIH